VEICSNKCCFSVKEFDKEQKSAQIVSGNDKMSTKLLDLEIMSNQQIEAEMGDRIRRRRLDMNISQTELARRAGVARRTITSVENGEGCSLLTLIALVRALRALPWIDQFLPDPEISPMALLAESEGKYHVKRARKHAGRAKKPLGEWKWGDEI
jgi:transcriptional regulator with XRE-family HTH domain